MNCLITCALYNDIKSLNQYLISINNSFVALKKRKLNNHLSLTILVANNGSDKLENFEIDHDIKLILHKNDKNYGYLNGIENALKENKIKTSSFDYFIISNVDLVLAKNFFTELFIKVNIKNTGWIAPKIYSLSEKKDRNPKIIARPSKSKISFLCLMYKIPILYYFYRLILYSSTRKIKLSKNINYIYAGHGSFMIFTTYFSTKINYINFNSFLFGEEIFIAELCKKENLKVEYYPSLEVFDKDHSSTSKIKRKLFFKMNYDSLKYVKSQFFN